MSQTGINPELNLDQLLAGMAEDVPPMPADFHDKWMSIVRAEAKQANRENQTKQEKQTEITEAPAPAPVSQWPRILSIAAVFVFLIGGTFIYRSARKPIMPEKTPDDAITVTETVKTEETVVTGTAMEKAADSADEAGTVMDTAGETGFAAVRPAADGPMMNMAEEIPASKVADKASDTDSAAEAPAVGMAMDSAGETAYESTAMEEASEAEEAGETEPAVKIAAEAPANTAPPTGSPAVEASESVPATRKGIGGFFADMGDFLLAVWPYLLIVLVPLAIVLIMKKTKK